MISSVPEERPAAQLKDTVFVFSGEYSMCYLEDEGRHDERPRHRVYVCLFPPRP